MKHTIEEIHAKINELNDHNKEQRDMNLIHLKGLVSTLSLYHEKGGEYDGTLHRLALKEALAAESHIMGGVIKLANESLEALHLCQLKMSQDNEDILQILDATKLSAFDKLAEIRKMQEAERDDIEEALLSPDEADILEGILKGVNLEDPADVKVAIKRTLEAMINTMGESESNDDSAFEKRREEETESNG